MIKSRKPLDIIHDVLVDVSYVMSDDIMITAEDIIEALESDGWYFVWDGSTVSGHSPASSLRLKAA